MYTLRQARRLREKTQQEMAAALGISRATYVAMEQNPGRITIHQIQRICTYLNLKFSDIAFDDVENS